MKNTLKIMGLALLAGSLMLSACKKNEEEEVATVVVTFDGEQQGIGWHSCASNEKDFLMEAAKELNGNDVVLPYVYHQFDNYGGANAKGNKWANDDLEFYQNEVVVWDSVEYGDWIEEETKSFDVDEFDANTLMLTYTNNSTMASMKDLVDGIDMDSCRRADISIKVDNVKFTLDNSKGRFHKRHIAK